MNTEHTLGSEYWDKIPLWNSAAPKISFDVIADKISGRIPVTRLEHWQDFTGLLESDFFNRNDTQLVFRGHRRYDWSLMPTLSRLTANGIVTEELSNKQLQLFRKAIRGRTADHALLDDQNSRENDELWSIGQHYGLMTPLLDWTYSPYVALFFAFAKEDQEDEKDNPYRAVYVLDKSFVADDDKCPDIRVFEPRKDDHGRLVSQAGLFTFSPFDATIENKLVDVLTDEECPDSELADASEKEQPGIIAKYICKIYIKNEEQQACLKYLRKMNVHHASLFPDLVGAADYCNIFITEDVRNGNNLPNDDTAEVPGISVGASNPINESGIGIKETDSILELLRSALNGADFDETKLKVLSEDIDKILIQGKLIDWQDREPLRAEMKNKTRIILRRNGFPEAARQQVIGNILSIGDDVEKKSHATGGDI